MSQAPLDFRSESSANLLVLSDLHIGQGMNGVSRFGALRRIARLDRELCAFLGHYAGAPVGGKPWRLVLAGDIIDFMQINLQPAGARAHTRWHSFQLTPDETRYGVGFGAERAVWKLEQVMARHRRLFLALGRFIAAGHEVCIVRGNHDDELHWEEVQAAFRHVLAELLVKAEPARRAPIDFAARVRFFPWFYYQEGVAYIEHGHQYDRFASFEYFLQPSAARGAARLDLPIANLAARYFSNLFPSFPALEQDTWSMKDYVRWAFGQGTSILRIAAMYLRLVFIVFFVHGRGRAGGPEEEDWLGRRLLDLEGLYGVPRGVLHRLHRLHAKPAGQSFFHSLQILFIDRILVFLVMVAGVVGATLLPVAAGTVAVLGFGWVLFGLLALWWLSRLRDVTSDRKLAAVAGRLADLLQVKFVVMGHSHSPVAAPLVASRPSWYLNTGTWVPPRGQVRHEGPCNCRLTHLTVLSGADGARAELRRWCTAARQPQAMATVGAPPV